jgi:mono/diheme cytochrome c family protein
MPIRTRKGAALTAATLAIVVMSQSSSCDGTASGLQVVDNFQLVDHNGFARELYRLQDAKAVVIAMHVAGNDASRRAATALAALGKKHPEVEFMMMNSSLADTRTAIEADAKATGIAMPILDDDNQLIGESLGAASAGEVFVIDPKGWRVVYRGAVDAKAAKKKAKGYVAEALAAVASGKPVTVAEVPVKGEAIAFPERDKAASFASISYAQTVAPILEQKCVVCHQEGGIGPFAMDRYETVKGFAPMIREVIRTDRMPPWQADPHVGTFQDDKSLTSEQMKTLVHWIEAGAPRGEGNDPLASVQRVAAEWPLGKPDMILDIPSFDIPASGVVDYQRPFILNPLKEGAWLKASTIKVSQRQGVHHILTGHMKEVPANGVSSEVRWGNSVGGYAVGAESTIEPENIGTYVPPGGAIGFQMHYTPFGKAVTDASQIGLYFYKDGELPELMMRETVIVDNTIKLPPQDGAHREIAYVDFPKEALLYAAFPHAHYRGAYSDLTLRYPDGQEKLLLRLPKYDFNWQRYYSFAEPVKIPAGSKLIATYRYDNSPRNPANPDPSKEIVWGDQSFEEMFYTRVRYRWTDETSADQKSHEQLANKTRMLGMMDDDVDGKIQPGELRGPLAQFAAHFPKADTNKDGGLDNDELQAALAAIRALRNRPAASGGQSSGQ